MITLAGDAPVMAETDEAWLVFSHVPGSEFGGCICGNCSASMDFLLDVILSEQRESRSPADVMSLEKKLGAVKYLDEISAQKEKLAILMVWLNKDRGHEDLIKCPKCKKVLIPDF